MAKGNKRRLMVEFEIDNCKKNIDFYRKEIENMEAKLEELEKLKKEYSYY